MKSHSFALAGVAGLAIVVAAPAAEWTPVADMPGLGRHHPQTFEIDGLGYVVTGTTSAGPTKDFFRYDPGTDEWTVLPQFPGPARSYAYANAYAGKGYLGFGSGGAGFFNDLWEYDAGTGQWTQLASCPGPGRQHPAFVITDNGKIFVGTGNTQAANLRDWWEYDIAMNTWTQRALLPGPARHHPYHFNIGNDAYVCFGHGASIYRDVYRWSQDTVSWTTMSLFPGEARVAGTEFSYGGKGYILSGEGSDHVQLERGEFWEYDPVGDSWTELVPHPGSGRWAPGSFLIGDTLYFMGGLSPQQLEKDMMKFAMSPATGVTPVVASASGLSIWPNPVTGVQLHIVDPDAVYRLDSARLFDLGGRRVAELRGDARTLELPHNLASGQYYVALEMTDGERVTRRVTVLR